VAFSAGSWLQPVLKTPPPSPPCTDLCPKSGLNVVTISTGLSHEPLIHDEVLTGQCPCLGLSIHGEYVGAWRIQRLQTETGVHMKLPRFGPPEGKDLHPACLILYCLYSWSCYNGAQMGSGYGRKRDGVC
jgi:hypothetical protein